jgi:hypothetical protein
MNKCTQRLPFVQDLFDDDVNVKMATRSVEAILKARPSRLSEITRAVEGNESVSLSMFSVSWKSMIRGRS